jgi:HK97 gp10 family phage protein
MAFGMNVQITGKQGMSDMSLPKAITAWETEVSPAFLAEIRRRSPVSKAENGGRLRDSINISRGSGAGGAQARITSTAPYAKFVTSGTGPHVIEPRQARALHWSTRGQDAFAARVNHPGTKANPFVHDAVKAMLPMMRQKLRTRIEQEFGQ